MSQSSTFLNLLLGADLSTKQKIEYLKLNEDFSHFSSLDEKSAQQIKSKISSLVGVSETRVQGLVFLRAYLAECKLLLTSEECISWATPCLQAISSKNVQERVLGFRNLKIIFEACAIYPEIYRMLSGTIVPHFVEMLPKIKFNTLDSESLNWLCRTLETCIETFKGPCFSRRVLIQDFLLKNVEQLNSSSCILLARPLALLAFTCASKQAGDTRHFRDFIVQTLFSINSLISQMFVTQVANEMPFFEQNLKPWLNLNSSQEHSSKILDFYKKLVFCTNVLCQLLTTPYEAHVKVPIRLILFTISRLSQQKITPSAKTANLDDLYTHSLMVSLLEQTLSVLSALIVSARQNLVLYITEVSNIFSELLKITNSSPNEKHERAYLGVRSSCYLTLALWFEHVGVMLSAHIRKQWTEPLITAFMQDVKYKQRNLQLHAKKSAKGERLCLRSMTSQVHANQAEFDLAHAVCICMETMLRLGGNVLNKKQFNKLGFFLLTELLELYQVTLLKQQTYFDRASDRRSLLCILQTLAIASEDRSFTSNALNVFTMALNRDPAPQVQAYARECLNVLSAIRSQTFASKQNNSLSVFSNMGDQAAEQLLNDSIVLTETAAQQVEPEKITKNAVNEPKLIESISEVNSGILNNGNATKLVKPINEFNSTINTNGNSNDNSQSQVESSQTKRPFPEEPVQNGNSNDVELVAEVSDSKRHCSLDKDESFYSEDEDLSIVNEIAAPKVVSQPVEVVPIEAHLSDDDENADDVMQFFVDK